MSKIIDELNHEAELIRAIYAKCEELKADTTGLAKNLANLPAVLATVKTGTNTNDLAFMFYNGARVAQAQDIIDAIEGKLATIQSCFAYAFYLNQIDVSGLDTSEVTVFDRVFMRAGLTKLDLSAWDFSALQSSKYMFFGMDKLTELTLGDSFLTLADGNALEESSIAKGTCVIKVPASLVARYKADPVWKIAAAKIVAK